MNNTHTLRGVAWLMCVRACVRMCVRLSYKEEEGDSVLYLRGLEH